jgi:predicted permease
MIDVFFNAVLPIFAVVAVGFAFGRGGWFDSGMATALNRFVFYIALPVLLFQLIATAPFELFEWKLILAYLLAELALYATGYLIARFGFKRRRSESLLLGMAASFANHVFFVLPIARQLYGDAAAMPVVAIITLDVVVVFVGTILILEATSERAQGLSMVRLLRLFARNPQIIGIGAGVLASIVDLPITGGLELFTRFVGDAAAPCSLFAIGLILAARNDQERLLIPLVISGLKLVAMPMAMLLLITVAFQISPQWSNPAMLVAAGPTGAMPFVLALQYKIPVAVIARTILVSTLGSLITVTLISQIG